VKTDGSADRLDSRLIGTLVSVNLSGGEMPKSRINGAQVSRLGLVGDAQDDTIHHGGPDRAVCVYSRARRSRRRSLRRPRPSQPKDPMTRVGLPPERPRF
jgi:hypothetical protein